MKLLFITQKIDKDDDILGVYHEWARNIAKSFDKFSVICLFEGRNELPRDIKVFSLGKERKRSRALYIKNFFKYILKLRSDYDAVFVHMNPVYVLFGWPVWKIMHKKVYLWYAHPGWNWQVKLAYTLADRVITSVPEAFHVRSKKVAAIGQGVDTELFKNTRFNTSINTSIKSSILYLGRISPSKNIHILIEALHKLKKSGILFTFTLVGSAPQMPGSAEYDKKVRGMVLELGLADVSTIHSSVPYGETVRWYNKSEIFVNLSPTGHFDKTVLEAMASGCITLASNDAYYNIFPQDLHELLIFKQGDADDLSRKIRKALELPGDVKRDIGMQMRKVVIKDHSLSSLGSRLYEVFSVVE